MENASCLVRHFQVQTDYELCLVQLSYFDSVGLVPKLAAPLISFETSSSTLQTMTHSG